MLDFLMVSTRSTKRGSIEIYPKFIIKKSHDLMIRGSDFYAIWVEERGLWSTDEQDALQLIDAELDNFHKDNRKKFDADVRVMHMWDAESGMIDNWHKYCQKQMRDSFHMLDEKLIFSNTEVNKKDYASRRLTYPLENGDISAYNRIIGTLYSEEERKKIEWAIGAIVTGDSKSIQKFLVLYGSAGTGKSTILNIVQMLFDGYYSVFDAKAIGSSNNVFALEAFKTNPLVSIQHDGDLSRIEDNTRLNSLVSHELMTVNEKFKSTYSNRFKAFLFMGTNKPVCITDAKSGLIRRLIDVTPSGDKLPVREYNDCMRKIEFELGAIACHCRDIYLDDKSAYDTYIPTAMLGASNDFYNFVIDSYFIFDKKEGTTLKSAWALYKTYCDDAKVSYPMSQRAFKEELKNYFREYEERHTIDDGSRVRNYYSGFKSEKFENKNSVDEEPPPIYRIDFSTTQSIFDKEYSDCPAQYGNEEGAPLQKWMNVKTKLSDLDTSKLHYVKVPENHIVIDFDIPDESGNKSFEKNLEEASKFPPTYAELSKSGAGIHLHYIYSGDVSKLSRVYGDHIEVKIFNGGSALRRKLSKCNNLPINVISSGLPMKGVDKMINSEGIKSEASLRTMIIRNFNKEIHPGTKPSIDFIFKILDDAYKSGLKYDVTDMKNATISFAANSTHQKDYCLKLVTKMKFKSEDISENVESTDSIIFYDVEVFPNLFVVDYKLEGKEKPVIRLINPTPTDIEKLLKFKLIGFNCRRYDNHIMYARLMGYTNEQLYNLSQKIIRGVSGCFFGEAYNLSYTDIYDFSSKKQSLKKFEIELGIHHQELGLPWDKPVPEELWEKVADYCKNDVIATEATFNARKSDFLARQILADLADMTVNDTTNSLTTRIIFGKNKHPQDQFNYRNMGDTSQGVSQVTISTDMILYNEFGDEYTAFDNYNRPIFPGYKYEFGKSTYRGEEVGEGGYVYAEPGMYGNVALLDIASMHPSSIVAENLFGDEYTQHYKDILDTRLSIKHKEFDNAKEMFDGKLLKYFNNEESIAALDFALKTPINSVYGLTSASFENPFRDPRNVDNIVAKRGALFMINLKNEVQKRGFKVAHIKTDSIKIPDATSKIIQFVMDYGKMYGYNFEHEATYDRMCLVNNAVYIAKYATVEKCIELYDSKYVNSDDSVCKKNKKKSGEWTATGTQFAVPYVFKKLFSKEDIMFEDMCEIKSVSTTLYLDMNENLAENEHDYHFVGRVGNFCPINSGCGGGVLLRETLNKKTGETGYAAATGSTGYRWMESEMVKELHKESDIDCSYYDKLVDAAAESISEYGNLEWFISDDPYVGPPIACDRPLYYDLPDNELPFE